ncbi:hypothetical protein HAX54_015481 [Datura stramonium]|uniref:Uncharacterized protein n=1 Tax=Datura stramonium TaxID=4076 RepID=A0ABS8RZD4_DATST|nr:hypothetical protein [Datura stramonium]
MKRGKIAGKAAIQNLMFPGHNINEGRNAFQRVLRVQLHDERCRFEGLGDASERNGVTCFAGSEGLNGEAIKSDSPFPLREADEGDIIISRIEKADEFISRFYRDLRREKPAFA